MKQQLLLATLLLPLLALSTLSQGNRISFPLTNGPNNVGTEFYLSFPANWESAAGEKYVRLYITADVETNVVVTAGEVFLREVLTVPNDIVTVDIPHNIAQVFVRDDRAPVPDDRVYEGAAVRITATEPIAVYGMNRTSFTSDGLLALPTSGLGRNYIVASASSVAGGQQELPSQLMVVAAHENTRVRIRLADDTPNHSEGDTVTVDLEAGDVYSMMAPGFNADLTGTVIWSDKPIAVMAGQNCTYLPDERYPACDHIVEMLPPVEAWDTIYHSVPFADRTKGDTYRIFASMPETKISLNGTLLATLPNVGGAEASGWIEYRQDEREAMVFSADKPIFVAQYNNSQTYDNTTSTDPFYLSLSPFSQSRSDIVISTPDGDFATNYLQVIGDSAAIAATEISPVGTGPWIELLKSPSLASLVNFIDVPGADNIRGATLRIEPGVYRIRSSGAIATYIYGGGSFDSYGYPAAMATRHLRTGDTSVPSISGGADSVSGVFIGRASDGLGNGDGSRISTIRLSPESYNYRLTVDELRPGIDTGASFSVTPIDPELAASTILYATDMAGNVTERVLTFAGCTQQADFSADSLDFGIAIISEMPRRSEVVLTNRGDSPVIITSLTLLANSSAFGIDLDIPLPVSLAPGQSLTIPVTFAPESKGEHRNILSLSLGCGPELTINLVGEGDDTVGVEDEGPILPLFLDLTSH